jgi:hypothetical protein
VTICHNCCFACTEHAVTLDTILCLHSDARRADSVVASLFTRPLPLLQDTDTHEPKCEDDDDESALELLFDASDDDEDTERVLNEERDAGALPDAELMALYIGEDEVVSGTDYYAIHTRKCPASLNF